MARHKRKIKLIKPQFQIKLVSIFLCLSVACMVVQFTLLNVALTDLAMSIPQYGAALSSEVFGILWNHLFLTIGLMVPLTLFVGILVTFRVAGPVYRFEQYFQAIADGQNPGECHIRNGDEFQELCANINQAMRTLRNEGRDFAAGELPANVFAGESSSNSFDDDDHDSDGTTQAEDREPIISG